MYSEIHKGIRHMLFELVRSSGRTDFADPRAIAALREQTRDAFGVLSLHAEKEERFLLPLLEKAALPLADANHDEHEEQEDRIAELLEESEKLDATTGHAFTVELSRFVGELLEHMADEEEQLMPALWAAYDDATLIEVHHRLLASMPLEQLATAARWMLPAMNGPERHALLAGAPPPAAAGLRGLARQVLSPEDDADLERRLSA
jgi:hypothetical protein